MNFSYLSNLLLCFTVMGLHQGFCQKATTPDTSVMVNSNRWIGLEKSIDSLVNIHLKQKEHVPGLVLSFTTADSLLFAKGYGITDINSKTRCDARQTHAMIASVAKVVTITAILQLIDQGKIRIDQPIAELVKDLPIKNPFPQKVLLKHVLTHTAGFDDYSIGFESPNKEGLTSLRDHLQKRLPPIVWPPGQYYNYSNNGVALLAYIVESVSGQSFDEYLQQSLFKSLKMNESGFTYNDKLIKNLMGRHYWYEDQQGKLSLHKYEGIKYTKMIGAAGFKTTAVDMAHLLQMYLAKGKSGGEQVLKPQNIAQALAPQFYYHPSLDRKQGWIWRHRQYQGITYNEHSGDDKGIESYVMIVPTQNIGFFISANSRVGRKLINTIKKFVLDKLKPSKNNAPNQLTPKTLSKADLDFFTGTYQYTNEGQTNLEKLTSYLFGDVYNVDERDGKLYINGNEYQAVGSSLFRRVKDSLLVYFKNDQQGSFYSTGYATFRKLSWHEKLSLHIKVLMGSLLLFLVSIIVWLIQFFRRSSERRQKTFNAKFFMGLSTFSLLAFFMLLAATTGGVKMQYGAPWFFNVYFTLPIIGVVLFVWGLIKTKAFFTSSPINLFSKIHFSVIALCMLSCLLIFYYYNALGYNY